VRKVENRVPPFIICSRKDLLIPHSTQLQISGAWLANPQPKLNSCR